MIELRELSVGYGRRAVLSDIAQDIPTGRLACLLGTNGAGKSTLLRTIAGFLPPLAGQVLLAGRDLASISLAERSHLVSVVLTERIDVPCMRLGDLVRTGRTPHTGFFGTLGETDRRLAAEAMEMVGIRHLEDRPYDTLSDGERQKAMIAKAIAQQTPVILLDEPTAFLDFHAKAATLRLLRRLAHTTGKAILLSTHDVEIALRLCDIIWIVQDGHIIAGDVPALTANGTLPAFLRDDTEEEEPQSVPNR